MEKYLVHGGASLKGEVTISGAKNAVAAILPAVILADGQFTIENVPSISDITVITKILQSMGAKIRMVNRTTLSIDTTHITESEVPYDLTKRIRSSYYFLGASLGRYSSGVVSMPGGCDFGVRPIDQHIKGFEALGAEVTIDHGMIRARAQSGRLVGSHVYFDVVSVGATINVMLAAVRARGLTVLENVAKEPHVVDLANFLNAMGADVRGAGTDVIKIYGVDKLHAVDYAAIPDQIEAGTYMVAAAATGGDVLIKNVIPKHLESITAKLILAGANVEEYDDSVRVSRTGDLLRVNVKTLPHPGFPTDMQPQMTALLTVAKGTSIVTEGVFDNRFKYVEQLSRMGASIQVDGKVAVVEGVNGLTAAPVQANDLRAGAALVIAALMAKGVTEIEEIQYVERGYDNLVEKLRAMGADIRKISVPDKTLPQAL